MGCSASTQQYVSDNQMKRLRIATAENYGNAGNVQRKLFQSQEAIKSYQNAIEIFEDVYGKNHDTVATCNLNIGLSYLQMNNLDKALWHLETAYETRSKVLGENHLHMSTVYEGLGSTYRAKGDLDKALKYQELNLAIRKQHLPPSHPDLALAHMNVATVLTQQRAFAASLVELKRAENTFIQREIVKDAVLARCYSAMGVCMVMLVLGGKEGFDALDQAAEVLIKANTMQLETAGPNHPDSAAICFTMGELLAEVGKIPQALECLEGARSSQAKVLGVSHPATIKTAAMIAALKPSH